MLRCSAMTLESLMNARDSRLQNIRETWRTIIHAFLSPKDKFRQQKLVSGDARGEWMWCSVSCVNALTSRQLISWSNDSRPLQDSKKVSEQNVLRTPSRLVIAKSSMVLRQPYDNCICMTAEKVSVGFSSSAWWRIGGDRY